MSRVNRVIELLEQDQPVYYVTVQDKDRCYEGGKALVETWADYLNFEMEHSPFDVGRLTEFMRGLADAGPTRSGHRTPTVIVSVPTDGSSEQVVQANAWQFKQALAAGIHGILLCHAETPAAVKTFVEACRYPFAKIGQGSGLDVGRRGSGGQAHAADIWGLSVDDYLDRADPWPLNPRGELFLGLKFENSRAVANCEATARVPGIAFAEWGPGDNAMSLGHPNNHDEPYPDDMWAVRNRVFAACKANGLHFLEQVSPENVRQRIDEGVRIGAGRHNQEAAEIGRRYSNRQMPA